MILNFALFCITTLLLLAYFYRVDRFQLTPLATNFHLFGATIYLVGTISIFDQSDMIHLQWVLYCLACYSFLIFGAIAASSIYRFDFLSASLKLENTQWYKNPSIPEIFFIIFMAISSIIATIYFFSLIGAVVPIEAAINLLGGADISESGKSAIEARKSIHYSASGEYYGAGYFAQFTNTILPISSLLLFYLYKVTSNKIYLALFILIIPMAIIAMTGTGRRGVIAGFIFFIIMWSRWRGLSDFRPSAKTRSSILLSGIIIVGFMTTVIAREVVSDNPIINSLYGFVYIFDRVFISPSIQELEIFISFLNVTDSVNGAGWLIQLNDILPGHRPSLANEIHAMLGGSEHGTAGFGQFGEKYYNFGWIGVLISFLWGFLLYTFDAKVLSAKKKDFTWIILCYAGFCLGMSAAPLDLFNGGFITCLIYLGCYKIFKLFYNFLLVSQNLINKKL